MGFRDFIDDIQDGIENAKDKLVEIGEDVAYNAENLNESIKEIICDELLKSFYTKKVSPDVGSIIICKITGNLAEHSGIYIGDGTIVELQGSGLIREVTMDDFLNDGLTRTGFNIYVACNSDNDPISSYEVSEQAKKMIGETRDYNFILNNCHQFTAGCITKKFENSINFFWMLVDLIIQELNNEENIRWNICDI